MRICIYRMSVFMKSKMHSLICIFSKRKLHLKRTHLVFSYFLYDNAYRDGETNMLPIENWAPSSYSQVFLYLAQVWILVCVCMPKKEVKWVKAKRHFILYNFPFFVNHYIFMLIACFCIRVLLYQNAP